VNGNAPGSGEDPQQGAVPPAGTKQKSLVIPLDAEAAMRALASFAYSGEGDPDYHDPRHREPEARERRN
jgi:hypothetical protein